MIMFGKWFINMAKKTNKSVSATPALTTGTTGQLTIFDCRFIPANTFTVFNNDSGEWMRWEHQSQRAEIKLGENWVTLHHDSMTNMHPLDFGASIDTKGKEDLGEIREQYEKHMASSPWLQKLRDDYNRLVEKHKLFDAIKGDGNAEV